MSTDQHSDPWTLSAPETAWLFDQAASRRGEGLTFAVIELVARGVFIVEYHDPPEVANSGVVARLVRGTEREDTLPDALSGAARIVSAALDARGGSLPVDDIPYDEAERYHDEVLVPTLKRQFLLDPASWVDRSLKGVGGQPTVAGERKSEHAVERLERLREFLSGWSEDGFAPVDPSEGADVLRAAGSLVYYDWDSYALIERLEEQVGTDEGYPYITSEEELALVHSSGLARLPSLW